MDDQELLTRWADAAVWWAEMSSIQSKYMVAAGRILQEYAAHCMSAEVAMHALQEEYLTTGKEMVAYRDVHPIPSVRDQT